MRSTLNSGISRNDYRRGQPRCRGLGVSLNTPDAGADPRSDEGEQG